MLPTIPPAPALKDERRIRFVVWVVVSFIVTIDACIATPLGLTWLYFGPLALAALRLPQRESIALAAICAAASFLFGPLGDPLGVHTVTLEVSARVQGVAGFGTAAVAYVGLGFVLHRFGRQQRIIRGLLPGAPEGVAQRVGNDVCKIVRRAPFPIEGGELAITASVGAAAGSLSAALIERADQAVYRSKQAGRDQLSLA